VIVELLQLLNVEVPQPMLQLHAETMQEIHAQKDAPHQDLLHHLHQNHLHVIVKDKQEHNVEVPQPMDQPNVEQK
jgi:hypothetical protein